MSNSDVLLSVVTLQDLVDSGCPRFHSLVPQSFNLYINPLWLHSPESYCITSASPLLSSPSFVFILSLLHKQQRALLCQWNANAPLLHVFTSVHYMSLVLGLRASLFLLMNQCGDQNGWTRSFCWVRVIYAISLFFFFFIWCKKYEVWSILSSRDSTGRLKNWKQCTGSGKSDTLNLRKSLFHILPKSDKAPCWKFVASCQTYWE